MTADGRVMGGYVHGIFGADAFRAHWLEQVGRTAARIDFEARVEAALDDLADHCEACLDLDALAEAGALSSSHCHASAPMTALRDAAQRQHQQRGIQGLHQPGMPLLSLPSRGQAGVQLPFLLLSIDRLRLSRTLSGLYGQTRPPTQGLLRLPAPARRLPRLLGLHSGVVGAASGLGRARTERALSRIPTGALGTGSERLRQSPERPAAGCVR